MDRDALNFAFSSCPNDTFAFHALVHGLVPGVRVEPHIDDVEALNARAEAGFADVTKISIAAYGRIRDRYALLRSGGAAGFGVGPIVVARSHGPSGGASPFPANGRPRRSCFGSSGTSRPSPGDSTASKRRCCAVMSTAAS